MKRILVSLILTLGAAGYGFGQCSSADKKALEAFDHAWGTATITGDRAALTSIYADDFAGLPAMQGKDAAIDNAVRAAERNKANPAEAEKTTYDHYLITCTANSATVTHRNTVWTPVGEGGKPETFYSRSVHFLERRGGKWQVVSNAGSGLDDSDVLWYLEQDYNDAIAKQDRSLFEKNYAADFSSISGSSGRLMNKPEDIADTVDSGAKLELAETTNMNIRIDGRTAIVTGVFRTKGTDAKGKALDTKIRYTDVWIKRDGRWQVWSSQGTPMP